MTSNTSKRILVVDDEKDLRDAIATALGYEGYEVTTAADGIEAVESAASIRPDMILLDIVMPRQNGIDALKAIRSAEWGKNIPVVIMTVVDDMNKLAEAVEAGASEYLVKTDIALGTIVQKVKSRLGDI